MPRKKRRCVSQRSNFRKLKKERERKAEKREAHLRLRVDSCELYCSEEKLTPVQENYYHKEWLNHIQNSSKLQNLPYVSVSSASNIGGKVASCAIAQSDIPVLVYSNASPRQPSISAKNLESRTCVLNNIYRVPTLSASTVCQAIRISCFFLIYICNEVKYLSRAEWLSYFIIIIKLLHGCDLGDTSFQFKRSCSSVS